MKCTNVSPASAQVSRPQRNLSGRGAVEVEVGAARAGLVGVLARLATAGALGQAGGCWLDQRHAD